MAAPRALAKRLVEAGAAGISALTVPEQFRGSPALLAAAVHAGGPVLMKDFVVTRRQLDLGRDAGASAVLLIPDILSSAHSEFASPEEALAEARARGLEALVEVYDDAGYRRAAAMGADLVGVNNRDLRDPALPVDPQRAIGVLRRCGPLSGTPVLALSGAATAAHVREQVQAGASGVLVGSALMLSADPAVKLRELLGGLA
jgi:indole-3-glycerol phosphate synthase